MIAFITLLATACNENQITEFTQSDLEQIQQDPNWVEITDIDTVSDNAPFNDLTEGGILVRSEKQLLEIYNLFEQGFAHGLDTLDLDFKNRDHILYVITSSPSEYKRSLMINDVTKEVMYIVEVQMKDRTYRLDYWSEWISIPKINQRYVFRTRTIVKAPINHN